MLPPVALVLPLSRNRLYSTVKVYLQYPCVPQWVLQGFSNYYRVSADQILVPFGVSARQCYRQRFSCIEIVLPMCKVKRHTQIIPRQNARQASADKELIWWLKVLVWFAVNSQELLSSFIDEQRARFSIDLVEEFWLDKALREERVSLLDN
jgi:hypothetical protein